MLHVGVCDTNGYFFGYSKRYPDNHGCGLSHFSNHFLGNDKCNTNQLKELSPLLKRAGIFLFLFLFFCHPELVSV